MANQAKLQNTLGASSKERASETNDAQTNQGDKQ
jgi:hypothetical protein